MIPLMLIWRYFRTRRLHFTDREALENWQAKRLHQFRQNVLSHYRYGYGSGSYYGSSSK